MFEELLEPIKAGEFELKQKLRDLGYIVKDVSNEPVYWHKDIDLLVTDTERHIEMSMEVKYDKLMAQTGNLFVESKNPRSTNGAGWLKFCQADLLAYGDAVNEVFYCFSFQKFKDYINNAKKSLTECRTLDGAYGYLVSLDHILAVLPYQTIYLKEEI